MSTAAHTDGGPASGRGPLRPQLSVVAALLLATASAHATDTNDLNALLSESIVSAPSRGSETASTAPATSSIVSADDLRRWGIRSLNEAINYLAMGMFTTNPLRVPEVGARGVPFTTDYGSHLLVLLDGHPLNEPWNGTSHTGIGLGVPIELIDHIEVILGPGSVMYGSQPMLGMIQVVTKNAHNFSGVHVTTDAGVSLPSRHSGELINPSFTDPYMERLGRWGRIAAGLGHEFDLLGKPAELTLDAQLFHEWGQSFELGPQNYGNDSVTGEPKNFGPRGTPGVWGGINNGRSFYRNVPALYGRLAWQELTLSVRASAFDRATPYTDVVVPFGDFDDQRNDERETWINVALTYQDTLSQLIDLTVTGYYDRYRYDWFNRTSAPENCPEGSDAGCIHTLPSGGVIVGNVTQLRFAWIPAILTNMVGVETKVRLIDSDLDITDLTTRQELPSSDAYAASELAFAAYFEQRVTPRPWLDLNTGWRLDYDQPSNVTALSPRAALGATLWDQGRLKVIYSEAFRAPSAYERNYANPTYQLRARNMSAEKVQSIEASLEQRLGSQRVLISAFRSWWRDMVNIHALSPSELSEAIESGALQETTEAYQYRNLARMNSYGLSLAFEGSLVSSRLLYGFNFTTAHSKRNLGEGGGDLPVTVGPTLFGNGRIAYEFDDPIPTLALAAQFSGPAFADRAFDSGFDRPKIPPHLQLRGTLTGALPAIDGLNYQLSLDYNFSTHAPYVIGPTQYAADPSVTAELAPVKRLATFCSLQYHFDP